MKVIIVALAFVAVAAAAAVSPNEYPKVLRSSYDAKPEGSYNFDFETEDGIKREENGQVKDVLNEDNKPQPVIVVKGSYSYTDPNGNVETIFYEADEQGYRAEGASIPKVPSRR